MDASIVEEPDTSAKNVLNPPPDEKNAIGQEEIIRRSAQGIVKSKSLTPTIREKPKRLEISGFSSCMFMYY